VNFYAHAVVAEMQRADAEFVLGAMLPDLAAMAGLRVQGTDAVTLGEGMQLHHESDRAFHACEAFTTLTREGAHDLRGAGLRRGPALGAAHVGIELLLDGWLVAERPPSTVYRHALERAASCSDTVRWRGRAGESWQRLCRRISSSAATEGCRDPDEVARRTARALERRPRLRLTERERAPLGRWLQDVRARVAHHGPALIDAVAPRGAGKSGASESSLHSARPNRGGSS